MSGSGIRVGAACTSSCHYQSDDGGGRGALNFDLCYGLRTEKRGFGNGRGCRRMVRKGLRWLMLAFPAWCERG